MGLGASCRQMCAWHAICKKKERGTKGPGWGCGCAGLVHGMLAHWHGMVAVMGAKRQAASMLASQQSHRLHVKYQDWSTFFNSNACLS